MSDLEYCRIIYSINNKQIFLENRHINLYIGALDSYEISNYLINENIVENFYSTNLKLAKFQLNYYNNLLDFNNNFDKRVSVFEHYKQNENCSMEAYCGEEIWSNKCNFALGALKMNSLGNDNNNNSSDTFLSLIQLKNYANFISIIRDFNTNYNFNMFIEFQLNSIQSSFILIRSQNSMLIVSLILKLLKNLLFTFHFYFFR